MSVLSRPRAILRMYPVLRGMITYSLIWPSSCLAQQIIAGKDYSNLDYKRALRFSFYGCFYVAPTLYCWIRLTTHIWPRTNFRTAVAKGISEQFTYGPFALVSFFFFMTLLEGRGLKAAETEVSEKFFTAYKVGWCVWPLLQTINHTFISERNRVPFVSMCSLGWTCFLAYMHQMQEQQKLAEEQKRLSKVKSQ